MPRNNFLLKACAFFIVLFLISLHNFAFAAITTQNYTAYYQDNGSALGKYNGPIDIYYPVSTTRYLLSGNDATAPNVLNYLNSNIPKTTQSGFSFLDIPNQDDGTGIEDATFRITWCDGAYTFPNSVLSDTQTRSCFKGWMYSGQSGTYIKPYSSDAQVNLADFASVESDFALAQANNQSSNKFSPPLQYFENYGQLYNPATGVTTDLGGLLVQRTCTPKSVCLSNRESIWRDSSCSETGRQNCDTVCVNGTCDPAPIVATNTNTLPISSYITRASSTDTPNFTSAGGLQQCKTFNRDDQGAGYAGLSGPYERYYINGPYYADVYIPNGVTYLFTLTAFDTADSNQLNGQSSSFWDYNEKSPEYISISDYILTYPSRWNSSTRILKFPLWPSSHDNTSPYFTNKFWLIQNTSYGTYTRGDSLSLQVQAFYGGSWSYHVGTTTEAVPQISNPAYFHYTLPNYEQCSPPAEVTTTGLSKTNLTCSDSVNNISWTAVSGADQYMVLVSTNPGISTQGYTVFDTIATTTSTSYQFPNPRDGQQYYVKVYAHNANGWNISNTVKSFTVADGCVATPVTPTNISVTAESYCGGGNSVSWNSVSGATGYRVYRSTSLNGTYTELTGSGGTLSIPFTDRTTNSSTTYYYKVVAFNSSGSSPQSSAASATTPAVCTTTGSVEITRYSTDLSTPANAPAGTQGKLDSLDAISSNPALYTEVSQGSHTAKATDLSGYVEKFGMCTYTIGETPCNIPSNAFTLTPTCSAGYCSISTYVSIGEVTKVGVMYIDPPSNPPTSLTASAGSYCGNQVDLSWDIVSDATGYRVYRSTSNGGTYSQVTNPSLGVQGTDFTDTAPSPNTVYYYKVASFNEAGTSPLSASVSATSTDICLYVGSVQISRYGTDLSTIASAPAGTKGQVDNLQSTTSNPALFDNISGNETHYAEVTNLPGYNIKMVSCTYNVGDTECNISGSQFADDSPDLIPLFCVSDNCLGFVYVPDNVVVKVAVMYTSTMGSIRVSHYDPSLLWPPATSTLPTNLISKVDSTTTIQLSNNPQSFDNLTSDFHTVFIPDVTGTYDVSYGSCPYDPAEQPDGCPLEDGQLGGDLDCDGTYCAIPYVHVDTGLTTKVGILYTELTSSVPAPVVTCTNCLSPNSPASGELNTPYTFSAVSNVSGQATLNRPTQTAQVSKILLAQATPTRLKYGFDWNADGVVEDGDWQPASDYVDLGDPVSADHSWGTADSYTFKVKAVDDYGVSSAWTYFTISIGDPCSSPQQGFKPYCTCNNGLNPNPADPINLSKMNQTTEAPLCMCDASQNRYQSGDSCVTCPSYKDFNSTNATCTCPPGKIDNQTNACVPSSLNIKTFNANPNVIYPGGRCNLVFSVEGATSTCMITGDGSSYPVTVDVNGFVATTSILTNPISSDTKYTLTCAAFDNLTSTTSKKTTCGVNPLLKER